MKNSGKQLEKLVRLVEESYKDSPHTEIYTNHKIPNKDGVDREIDVLIITKINGISINIAIECKDYASKISVDKIEAFHSKCLRLPQINKKIFVSGNGYQRDAVNAAKDFGIELLTAENLNRNYIEGIIPIRQIKPVIHDEVKNLVLTLDCHEEKTKEIQKIFDNIIFNNDCSEESNILILLKKAIHVYSKEIFSLSLLEYMKLAERKSNNLILWIPFELGFNECYIKDEKANMIKLFHAAFQVKVQLVFILPQNISGRSIKHTNGMIKAESVDIQTSEGLESHIIIRDNCEIDFFVTENQQTRKLETLFTYNPKTDKFTKDNVEI